MPFITDKFLFKKNIMRKSMYQHVRKKYSKFIVPVTSRIRHHTTQNMNSRLRGKDNIIFIAHQEIPLKTVILPGDPLDWSLAIFKKRTKHVVIASEVKQPSTEF